MIIKTPNPTKFILRQSFAKRLVFVVFAFVLMSCKSLRTAAFDQYSYQQAISIKVEGLNFMDNATEAYTTHETNVETLILDLKKMVEYEKNKPNNEVTYAMWKLIADKDKNLMAGFFKRWETENTLSTAFTTEAKQQIGEAFDLIIAYEAKKNKTNKSNILNFLTKN